MAARERRLLRWRRKEARGLGHAVGMSGKDPVRVVEIGMVVRWRPGAGETCRPR